MEPTVPEATRRRRSARRAPLRTGRGRGDDGARMPSLSPAPDTAAELFDEAAPVESVERDHGELARGAIQAALTLLLTNTLASLVFASTAGIPIDIRLVGGIVPTLGLRATAATYAPTLTATTAVAVGVTGLGVLWNLWRRRDQPQLVLGWVSGLGSSLVLLAVLTYRHLTSPPVIEWWGLLQIYAFVVAVGLIVVAFRPTGDGDDPTRSHLDPKANRR